MSSGALVFFQKPHEIAGSDWTADGTPLRQANWLSQSVQERRCVYFLSDDYENFNKELGADFWDEPQWTTRRDCIILPTHAVPERVVETVTVEYKPTAGHPKGSMEKT